MERRYGVALCMLRAQTCADSDGARAVALCESGGIVNGYWITESTTWKIFAESEDQAREIWQRYWRDGERWEELDMKPKDGSVEADWSWEDANL